MVDSVASTARPSAPPTCAVVLTRPEARPASSWVAPDIASVISAGKDAAEPMPSRSIDGQDVASVVAVHRRAGEQQQPDADQHQPGDQRSAARRSA